MAGSPPYPDSGDRTEDDHGTPRWVKVFGIVAIAALIVAFVIMHTVGGGFGGGHG